MTGTYEERLEARVKEYRRALISIASIEVDWRIQVVTAQEAMEQIAAILRKATET
jgi:hypothetical protein